MASNQKNDLYTKDSIESLSPLEHVRLRPGVYAGDTSNPNHLLLEIFSNALDEHNIGHGNKITVVIHPDTGVCEVIDEGQGFPINEKREDGLTVLEAAFSVMNTSGKFRDDGVYEGTSLGLNGMGGKLSNFLSHWFEVVSWKNGKYENLHFEEGVLSQRFVGKIGDDLDYKVLLRGDSPSGTTIQYQPSEEFFDSAITDGKYFENFFHDICCLCPSLVVHFSKDGGKSFTDIAHPRGIEEILPAKVGNQVLLVDNPLIINYEDKTNKFDLALTFTTANSANILPYVNFGYTAIGPHITAMKTTITRVINSWAREQGLLKEKEKNLDGNSVQEGMLLVCNIITQKVSYNAQVKTTVTKIDSKFATDELASKLEIWLDNNPTEGKNIVEKALLARRAAEAAKKAREAVKNKAEKKDKVFKLPTTLADCWTKDRSKAELLICEGKSAASGLVAARDSEFQAVYGVRGKMLSVLKSTPAAIMKNQEINNLVQALGLDYDPTTAMMLYDKDKLRYDKIIACADADPDGYAIENLLFNILWFMCPELVINGHVYSSIPPLYRVTNKKNEYIYLRGDAELAEYKQKFGENSIQALGRMKGLGECDSEELSYCLLEPETRNVVQLVVEDIGTTDKMFNDLYGKQVEPRVKFLAEHLEEAHID